VPLKKFAVSNINVTRARRRSARFEKYNKFIILISHGEELMNTPDIAILGILYIQSVGLNFSIQIKLINLIILIIITTGL